MAHSIGWFDIPVNDLDRATAFYRNVLEISLAFTFTHSTVFKFRLPVIMSQRYCVTSP